MNQMLNIPKNHKPRNPLRLILIMGVAAFLFVIAGGQLDDIATSVTMTR